MQNGALGQSFLDAIRESNIEQVFRFPGMLREVLPPNATNAEALSAMTEHDLHAIAVVGEDRKMRGVVEREQLVSKLVLSLAQASSIERL
jgi:CBS-domain-containing membrane protein